MIARLKDLLARTRDGASPRERRTQLAAAAILVEAALMDGRIDADERGRIAALLAGRFKMSAAEAAALLENAAREAEASVQLHGFIRELKDAFAYEERVGMIEMLWEVVYADGHLHDYEANLVRRVAGLLFVSDQDAGAARKRVLDGPASRPDRN